MTMDALLALAAAVFIFSLKPGLGILTSISYSMSHGVSGLVAFLSGFNVGLAMYLGIVFIGLAGIGHFNLDIIFLAVLVKSFAAVYLVTIGAKELFKWDNEVTNQMAEVEKGETFFEIASSAVILTLSNPMIIVFYASIIPVFIPTEAINIEVAILVAGILMLIDSIGMLIYCTPILLFRKSLPATFMKYIKLLSAVLIIFIGLYIGYTALPSNDILSLF